MTTPEKAAGRARSHGKTVDQNCAADRDRRGKKALRYHFNRKNGLATPDQKKISRSILRAILMFAGSGEGKATAWGPLLLQSSPKRKTACRCASPRGQKLGRLTTANVKKGTAASTLPAKKGGKALAPRVAKPRNLLGSIGRIAEGRKPLSGTRATCSLVPRTVIARRKGRGRKARA